MAFCDGDNLKFGSAAWVSGALAADDRKFKDLVKQAAISMLPAQDGEETGETNEYKIEGRLTASPPCRGGRPTERKPPLC